MDSDEEAPLNQISIPAETGDKATASLGTPSVLTTPASVLGTSSVSTSTTAGTTGRPLFLESPQDYHFVQNTKLLYSSMVDTLPHLRSCTPPTREER